MSKINKITIRLPIKSSASAFTDVNNLLKNIHDTNIVNEGKYKFIEFKKINNLLEQIIESSYKLSAFKLLINDEEVDRKDLLRTTRYALFCPFYNKCKGICMVDLTNSDYEFQKIETYFEPERLKRKLYYMNKLKLSNFIERNSWISFNEQNDATILDKDLLKQDIKQNLIIQEKYCEIFDWEKLESKFNIPDTIPISNSADSSSNDINGEELDPNEEELDPMTLLIYIADLLENLPQKLNETMRNLFIEAGLINGETQTGKSTDYN